MPVLGSNLDTRSEVYQRNRADMLGILETIDKFHGEAPEGGGEEAMNRLRSRNMMPIQERISLVLDQDSPFLKITQLAAWHLHYKVGSGFVVGVGVILGVECLILGHDPSVRAGAEMHSQVWGLGDYLAENELDGIRMCREVVSHLNWRKKAPGTTFLNDPPVHDADELLGIVPKDLRSLYDMREVIGRVVDGSRFEEFKPLYGPTLVCGWASVDAYPVGIVGNNGVLFSESSEKAVQFIKLCNQIDVPLLFLHNITGYIVRLPTHHLNL